MKKKLSNEVGALLSLCLRRSLLVFVLAWVPILWGCGDDGATANPTTSSMEEEDGGQGSSSGFWGSQDGSVGGDIEQDSQDDEDSGMARPDLPVIGGDDTDEEEVPQTCGLEDVLAPNQSAETAYEAGTDFRQGELYICPATSDWFRFEAQAGQTIFVYAEFEGEFGDLDLYLYREGQAASREQALAESTSPDRSEFISFDVAEDGIYLAELSSFEFSQNQYLMLIKVACENDRDCPEGTSCFLRGGYCEGPRDFDCGIDEGYEPNESVMNATELDLARSSLELTGMEICPDDTDYYRIVLNDPTSVRIGLESSGDDVDVFLFTEDGVFIAQAQNGGEGKQLDARFLSTGSYIVLVDQSSGEDAEPRTYDLEVSLVAEVCEEDGDCTGVVGREFCDGALGACQGIDAAGDQALGEPCDDDGDCVEDAAGCYEGTAGAGDNICTVLCSEDRDCAVGLGEAAYCLEIDAFRDVSICVNPCADDFGCSFEFYCTESGRCVSRDCSTDADCPRPDDACIYDDEQGWPGQGGLCLEYDRYQEESCGVGEAPDDGANGSSSRAGLIGLAQELSGLLICVEDEDWFVVELVEESQWLGVSLSFEGEADLDLYLFDEGGRAIDESTAPDANLEEVSGRYLEAGRYFLRVNHYPSEGAPEEVGYSLAVQSEPEDCRGDQPVCDQTTPLRILCSEENGACLDFEGGGAVQLGGECDSNDDCDPNAQLCWTYNGGGETNICTHFCESGEQCEDVPGSECVAIGRGFGVCILR